MTSSISRQLVLWLAVPLMLLALGGALVHYFTNVAPGVISSDRRLKEAANALMARIQIDGAAVTLDAVSRDRPSLPSPDSIKYAVRDAKGRLLLGDAQIPVVPMPDTADQVFAVAQLEHRNVRTLSTRFDTSAGVLMLTALDGLCLGIGLWFLIHVIALLVAWGGGGSRVYSRRRVTYVD